LLLFLCNFLLIASGAIYLLNAAGANYETSIATPGIMNYHRAVPGLLTCLCQAAGQPDTCDAAERKEENMRVFMVSAFWKSILLTIAIAASPSGVLLAQSAQSITGTWQGTLKVGNKDLRVVVKISTTDKDALEAVVYSIDQNPQPTPAREVTLQGETLRISVPPTGIITVAFTYEGKVSADGNSVEGTFTQAPVRVPLKLARATGETTWPIPESTPLDWRRSVLTMFLSQCRLTKATADKSAIITAGSVVVLKKDNLILYSTASRFPPGDSYVNGVIKAGFMSSAYRRSNDGSARTFVAGEKLWVTRFLFEPKNDGVVLEFLSDPYGDNRYWGTLKFSFAKGSPAPGPGELAQTLAQVIEVESSSAPAPVQADPAEAAAAPSPANAPPAVAPAEEAPPPIAPPPPPPPPPDQPAAPPPTVALGQTKDQLIAIMGQPVKIASLGAKQIYFYKEFKVTLTGGKVTNIE
jgi:hypothetical protein